MRKFRFMDDCSQFILTSNSSHQQTINYDFFLKLQICGLLIVSKLVVKFR